MTDIKPLQLLKGCSAYFFCRYPKGHLDTLKDIFGVEAGGCAVDSDYAQFSETERCILKQVKHYGLACWWKPVTLVIGDILDLKIPENYLINFLKK